jgi:cephalosporin hydroxylase
MLNATFNSAPASTPNSGRDVDWGQVITRFHQLWYYGFNGTPPWMTTTWMGVPCQKCPFDAWMLQEILFRTKPELVIETGIRWGGSSLYIASLMDIMGTGQVMSVDIALSQVYEPSKKHPRVTMFEGSSVDPDIVAKMAAAAQGKRTMVILDSDHSAPHVLKELEVYAPLVTPGHYLIVEDTNINGHPVIPNHGPGPMEALDQYMPAHRDDWILDQTAERLYLSFFPRGYWVRAGGDPIPQPRMYQ